MSELLITSSLDPVYEGQRFEKSLPRHVTVWQYFSLPDEYKGDLISRMDTVAEAFSPITIEGTEYAEFGPDNDVPVRRVKSLGRGATLAALHTTLGTLVELYGGEVQNPEWAYEGFNPHITYVNGMALDEGEQATLQTLELIEKEADTRDKVVQKMWNLEEA